MKNMLLCMLIITCLSHACHSASPRDMLANSDLVGIVEITSAPTSADSATAKVLKVIKGTVREGECIEMQYPPKPRGVEEPFRIPKVSEIGIAFLQVVNQKYVPYKNNQGFRPITQQEIDHDATVLSKFMRWDVMGKDERAKLFIDAIHGSAVIKRFAYDQIPIYGTFLRNCKMTLSDELMDAIITDIQRNKYSFPSVGVLNLIASYRKDIVPYVADELDDYRFYNNSAGSIMLIDSDVGQLLKSGMEPIEIKMIIAGWWVESGMSKGIYKEYKPSSTDVLYLSLVNDTALPRDKVNKYIDESIGKKDFTEIAFSPVKLLKLAKLFSKTPLDDIEINGGNDNTVRQYIKDVIVTYRIYRNKTIKDDAKVLLEAIATRWEKQYKPGIKIRNQTDVLKYYLDKVR